MKLYGEALQSLNYALTLDKSYYHALLLIAKAYYRMKKYKEAKDALAKAIKIDGTNYRAFLGLGDLQLATNELKKAKRNIKKAYRLEKNYLTYKGMGHIYLIENNLSRSIQYYARSKAEYGEQDKFVKSMFSNLWYLAIYGVTELQIKDILSKI